MGHRVYAAVLGVAVVLLVGGCSDEPEPKFADPTSEVPTSTGVEPVTDPPTSDATVEPRPETAKAFLRRYGDLEREMQASGDTKAYRAISDGCKACDNLADAVDSYYAAGGSIEWDGWTSVRISSYDKLLTAYLVVVQSTPTTYTESANGPTKTLSGGRSQYVFELRREGMSWVVTDKDNLVS